MEKYISLRLVLMPRSQLPEHVASILVSTKMMHLFLLRSSAFKSYYFISKHDYVVALNFYVVALNF